jgi:hypothetical protein
MPASSEKPQPFTADEKTNLLAWLKAEHDAGRLQPAPLGRTEGGCTEDERALAEMD